MRMDGSPFFSARAKPICAFTRADLDRMSRERRENATREHDMTIAKSRLAAREAVGKRRSALMQEAGPVYVPAPTADCKVLAVAAKMYGVTVRDLLGPRRHKIVTLARIYVVYRLHYELGRSYPQIATLFSRDHTSIISLLRPRRGRAKINTLPVDNCGALSVKRRKSHNIHM